MSSAAASDRDSPGASDAPTSVLAAAVGLASLLGDNNNNNNNGSTGAEAQTTNSKDQATSTATSEQKAEPELETDASAATDKDNDEDAAPLPPFEPVAKIFPEVLHDIISNPEYSLIVAWLLDGKAFRIYDREKFAEIIMPKHFQGSKFSSFARRLKRWRFERMGKGPLEAGAYHHPDFNREEPQLVQKMIYTDRWSENSRKKEQARKTLERDLADQARGSPGAKKRGDSPAEAAALPETKKVKTDSKETYVAAAEDASVYFQVADAELHRRRLREEWKEWNKRGQEAKWKKEKKVEEAAPLQALSQDERAEVFLRQQQIREEWERRGRRWEQIERVAPPPSRRVSGISSSGSLSPLEQELGTAAAFPASGLGPTGIPVPTAGALSQAAGRRHSEPLSLSIGIPEVQASRGMGFGSAGVSSAVDPTAGLAMPGPWDQRIRAPNDAALMRRHLGQQSRAPSDAELLRRHSLKEELMMRRNSLEMSRLQSGMPSLVTPVDPAERRALELQRQLLELTAPPPIFPEALQTSHLQAPMNVVPGVRHMAAARRISVPSILSNDWVGGPTHASRVTGKEDKSLRKARRMIERAREAESKYGVLSDAQRDGGVLEAERLREAEGVARRMREAELRLAGGDRVGEGFSTACSSASPAWTPGRTAKKAAAPTDAAARRDLISRLAPPFMGVQPEAPAQGVVAASRRGELALLAAMQRERDLLAGHAPIGTRPSASGRPVIMSSETEVEFAEYLAMKQRRDSALLHLPQSY
ncbi:hypothetical protein ACHAWF_008377 [Thalassiosira exigua]